MSLLEISLSAAVPLWIIKFKQRGGPTDSDRSRIAEFAPVLASRGDVLMFGGGKKNEPADLFNRLAEALAVMAFYPGGVHAFGHHWDASQFKVPDGSASVPKATQSSADKRSGPGHRATGRRPKLDH